MKGVRFIATYMLVKMGLVMSIMIMMNIMILTVNGMRTRKH